jgi:hypothetical protein
MKRDPYQIARGILACRSFRNGIALAARLIAFALFVWVYSPILAKPNAGREAWSAAVMLRQWLNFLGKFMHE